MESSEINLIMRKIDFICVPFKRSYCGKVAALSAADRSANHKQLRKLYSRLNHLIERFVFNVKKIGLFYIEH